MSILYPIKMATRPLCNYFFLFLCALSPTIVNAQCPGTNTGYLNPAVGVNVASTGTDPWLNPGNTLTDNNSFATMSNPALLIGGTIRTSNFLILRNLGVSLPNNASICGVQVEVRKFSSDNSASNYTRDLDIRLLKNNTVTGTNHANTGVNWPTTETAFTYGTNADLWGTTLTGFDVSSNGFGVAIGIESKAAGLLLPTVISYIDQVRIRIYYYIPFTDIDGDGIADEKDGDIDGDGLPNSKELVVCNTPANLTLSPDNDPSLTFLSAAGVSMNVFNRPTAGAGVSEFNISEVYTAVAGPEIKVAQDVATAADNSVVFMKFNKPVQNLSFKLQDVDLAAGQFRDNVTVNAYSNDRIYPLAAANFTLGTGNFNQFIGNNSFEGLAEMNDNEVNGTITIRIPDLIDSVKIIFNNTDANLGFQVIGIGEISYCNPNSILQDSDGDGTPNFRDADSDNDGIPDLREIQSSAGYIAPTGTDTNNNGIDDVFDLGAGGVSLTAIDTDGDGTPDYLDNDSDNDGNSDRVEGNDADHNCIADFALSGIDTDGDGLDNSYDPNNGGTAAPMQDTDGNGVPDYRQNATPTTSSAGIDQTGNNVTFTLAANTPVNGLGYWKAVAGAGTFGNINSPVSTVTNLNAGTNIFEWVIYTDGCHFSVDNVTIQQLLPLPVNMSGLNAKDEGGAAVLRWSTYSEFNNSGFAIMHSTDGVVWKQIDFVRSLALGGNSNTLLNYIAYHKQPVIGRNYYRLQQKDIDGASTFSNIQSLMFAQPGKLVIYPNPVVNKIILPGADAQNIKELKLLDATGKLIFVLHKNLVTSIDMTGYAGGTYFLQVMYKDGTLKSSKILKQ